MDDTSHPVPPSISCLAACRNLFFPQTILLDMPLFHRRFHMEWARHNTQ